MMGSALRDGVAILSLIIGLLSLVMSVWYPSLAVRFRLRSRLRSEDEVIPRKSPDSPIYFCESQA